jgi:hypothetical protein
LTVRSDRQFGDILDSIGQRDRDRDLTEFFGQLESGFDTSVVAVEHKVRSPERA